MSASNEDIQLLIDTGKLDEARGLMIQRRETAKKAREAAVERENQWDRAIASLDRIIRFSKIKKAERI